MSDPAATVLQLSTGYWISCGLHTVTSLGVPDALAAGPKKTAELAAELKVQEEQLFRLLRALETQGVFQSSESGWELTPVSRLLTKTGGMRDTVLVHGGNRLAAWSHLADTVRTGKTGFEIQYGQTYAAYTAEHPEEAVKSTSALAGLGMLENPAASETYRFDEYVTDTYEFAAFGNIVMDISTARGTLLFTVLRKYPTLTGILVAPENIIESVRTSMPTDLAGRVKLVPGTFSTPLDGPNKADTITLRHIVNNLADEEATRVLANARSALLPGGRVLLIETIVEEFGSALAKWHDVHEMVMRGGKERTVEEYKALLEKVGLRLEKVHKTQGDVSIIEATLA